MCRRRGFEVLVLRWGGGRGTCGGASGSRRILPPSGCRSPAVVDVARPCCRSKNLFTPVEKPSVGGQATCCRSKSLFTPVGKPSVGGAAKLAELWRPGPHPVGRTEQVPAGRCSTGRCRQVVERGGRGPIQLEELNRCLPGDVRPAGVGHPGIGPVAAGHTAVGAMRRWSGCASPVPIQGRLNRCRQVGRTVAAAGVCPSSWKN